MERATKFRFPSMQAGLRRPADRSYPLRCDGPDVGISRSIAGVARAVDGILETHPIAHYSTICVRLAGGRETRWRLNVGKRVLLIAVAVLALPVMSIRAQEPKNTKPTTEQKVEAFKPNLSGFLQTDYRMGDDAGRTSNVEHEFMLRRARLTVSGKAQERINYSLTAQMEGSTTAILDAWVDYAVNPLAKVRFGQFKYHFDLVGRESSASLAMIDRPFAANSVAGSMNGASTASSTTSNFRDRGVTIYGDTTKLRMNVGYSLGVFQGAGRNADNNDAFGYVLNARVSPTKSVRLNAGFLSADAAPKGDGRENQYDAWTGGIAYENKKATVTAEYYSGSRDRGTVEQEVSGYYATASYSPHPRVDVLGQYQVIEDDRFATGNAQADSVDVGVRWYFVRKGVRSGTHVSINYMSRSADDGFTDGLTLLNDGKGPALTSGKFVKDVIAVRFQVQF